MAYTITTVNLDGHNGLDEPSTIVVRTRAEALTTLRQWVEDNELGFDEDEYQDILGDLDEWDGKEVTIEHPDGPSIVVSPFESVRVKVAARKGKLSS